jgi:ABC-type sugar transport system ATPase subunit
VVYVTHDQSEALSLGQRVAVLEAGGLRQIGGPEEVYNKPAHAFVGAFVGSPPMNLVPAEVVDEKLRGAGDIVLPLPAGAGVGGRDRVLAGFRAEGLRCLVAPGTGFAACLDAVERAGHERLWQLSVGAQRLVARPAIEACGTPGETVHVAVDRDAVRLFDPESGLAL